MAKVEKLCSGHLAAPSRKYRRWLKTRAARLIRRAAKRDPENAPRRLREVTRGWDD